MKRWELSRLRPAAGVLAVVAALAGGQAIAADCARPQELHALNTRVLQTELMVAALACGYQAGYNRFVGAFRHDLIEQGGTLRATLERNSHDRLRIAFSDTGRGMSPDQVEHLFEPFSSTTGGTGLGLSIVYQIIRDHGGTINVRSLVGQGTTITVELPEATEPTSN